MASIHDVYTGFWRDYSKNESLGLTLTLTASNGALLIAFLALFVALVGARSWVITTFAIHQFRATDDSRDALHYQSQLMLRNAGSEMTLATEFCKLAYAWRKKGIVAYRRTFPIALAALIHFALFTAAGLFSSRIALNQSGPNNALLTPFNCGDLDIDAIRSENQLGIYSSFLAKTIRTALSYVDTCYDTDVNTPDCATYATRSFNFTVDEKAECPFQPGWRCCYPTHKKDCKIKTATGEKYDTARAISFDTGKIDVLSLGYNVPLENRVLYRKRATCAPISFGDGEVKDEGKGLEESLTLYIGTSGSVNNTYEYFKSARFSQFGYQAVTALAKPDPHGKTDWQPTKDFFRKDADVSMVFISQNSIVYPKPVDDRVFGAHYVFPERYTNLKEYMSDQYVSAIGCADQYQICNAKQPDRCTPLVPGIILKFYFDTLDLNEQQNSIAHRIVYSLVEDTSAVGEVVGVLGAGALKANDRVADGYISNWIPDNQWKIETKRWFAASLANLQGTFVRWVSKREGTVFGIKDQGTYDKYAQQQCHRQIVQVSGSYQSFSVLGLALTLIFGLVILAISLTVEQITAYFQRLAGTGKTKRLQLIGDELLQTQRFAFEDSQRGIWQPGNFGIPITTDVKAKFPHLFQSSPTTDEKSPMVVVAHDKYID